MNEQKKQMAVKYTSLLGDGNGSRWESSLDKIFSSGCYVVEIEHSNSNVGLPMDYCGSEHYIVGTLAVTDSGTNGPLQNNRAAGQILILTSRKEKETKLFTRTHADGAWGAWHAIAQAGMYDNISNADELYATVAGLVTETKKIDADLSSEITRAADVEKKLSASIKPIRYVIGDNSIADCFVYVKFKQGYKEITIQRFMGISDTEIIYFVYNDDGTYAYKTLKYANAEINGTQYTWKTDDYIIIVDFAYHDISDTIATSSKSTICLSHKCFDDIYENELPVLNGEIEELTKVPKQQGYYISTAGKLTSTTSTAFWTSSYLYAEVGVRIVKAKPVSSAAKSYIHFYDSNYNHISYIASSETSEIAEVIITEEDIPEGARYMRAVVGGTGDVYAKRLIDLNDIAPKSLGVPFDYETALSMDKNLLRNAVETASAGKCTVLYDSDGYPSLMYRIPLISIGAFSQELGDFLTPHPAFIVGGVRKNEIYMSVFQTCVYNGHYVSWFGLPSVADIELADLRSGISAKGSGWHLETIFERSLLALLTMKYNSKTPRGNTNYGRSSAVGYEYECVKMFNGKLPGKAAAGEGEQQTGAKWINGTQPHSWSHDKSAWGIQDVIGGYHEICDLIKMVDGYLYMPEDNNYLASEEDWLNTGVAIDVINGNVFSNTVTSSMSADDTYITTNVDKVGCTEGYDTLPENMRKKMVLLLLAPRLSSADEVSLLGLSGTIASRPAGVGYLVSGGASEYENSGLGRYNIAYDLSTVSAHNNMGSRMVYIG